MSLSLNVLNHLGINLYSNIPAVLSEAVANAWDADATRVDINFDLDQETIEIIDNGHGMTVEDLNNKFLFIGYQRREHGEGTSLNLNRPVMGRKGIGKLSMFSVAENIEVHSVRNGAKAGLVLKLADIKAKIKAADEAQTGFYFPEEVPSSNISIAQGTRIKISHFRRNIKRAAPFLKTRLARRFAIVGQEHAFQIFINGEQVGIEDRGYFKNLQYLWTIGSGDADYGVLAINAEKKIPLTDRLFYPLKVDGTPADGAKEMNVYGWIGTFREAGQAKDEGLESLNNISVIVRKKLAQENILDEFGDAGIYAQYIIGEIHADFLDDDSQDDLATSSRQRLIEDDPRYIALSGYVKKLIAKVRDNWTEFRNDKGEAEARKNAKIDKWMGELKGDNKKKAKALFGKIYQMPVNEEERNRLFVHSVIAFESLKYKEQLDTLEDITADNLSVLAKVLGNFDEIEASMYHRITKERIQVIKTLHEKVDDNALEKVIQEYLFRYLWLLDPMWERASETPVMEQSVATAFAKVDAGLTAAEKAGRLDIRYKSTSGTHIIIELKRDLVSTSVIELIQQVQKYRSALQKCLKAAGKEKEPIEIIIVLGKYPSDWEDEGLQKMLDPINARVVLYRGLIDSAYKSYQNYLEKEKDAGALTAFLDSLEASDV
ncbi:ATP-binding protein [Asticcacaulis sp. DW145]|uniref:BbrUII/HgiDII family restriction enzyme n=1 Tax=Asticcacaulis sp. DW145 TaxID=3095608 RepID=UPI00308C0C94|nr:ATP-binding protein [Asticcacaulis sp. DW145]